ncbi:MAG TPA: zinc-dependent peptidase [Gemmatales bacterium]|nr:zinc-dependent peptidase [Gemmatales bacterium]
MFFTWFRDRRRQKWLQAPWPAEWMQFLERNVAHYRLLDVKQQKQLRDIARILIEEKYWEACNGVEMTDEIKVTISAQAALPLLGIEHDYYERVMSILVYPSTFLTARPDDNTDDAFVPDKAVLGQAVYRGPVILAWDEVLHEGRYPEEGSNVVVHEFAHQLDFLDNSVDGVPPLANKKDRERWLQVMNQALEQHRQTLDHHQRTFFSPAAAESLTEFFAYSSELYFCRPIELSAHYPQVFEMLQSYYRIDPRLWFAAHQ